MLPGEGPPRSRTGCNRRVLAVGFRAMSMREAACSCPPTVRDLEKRAAAIASGGPAASPLVSRSSATRRREMPMSGGGSVHRINGVLHRCAQGTSLSCRRSGAEHHRDAVGRRAVHAVVDPDRRIVESPRGRPTVECPQPRLGRRRPGGGGSVTLTQPMAPVPAARTSATRSMVAHRFCWT